MKAVIGLGNPGRKYEETRHNVGFRVIDRVLEKNPGRWQTAARGLMVLYEKPNFPLLVKPETFVNDSGRCVRELIGAKALGVGDLLVISDEIQMNVGQIKFSARGSSGGHNGLQSILDELGTAEFQRLRIGVRAEGEKATGDILKEYVLGGFPDDAKQSVEKVLDTAAEAVLFWFQNGVEAAMNKYN